MQVTLFKALKSIKIDDATATSVVDDLEAFMKSRMEEVTKPIEAKLTMLQWMIGIVGGMIAIGALFGPIFSKLVH
jgi:hypothetical protein